MKCEYYYEIISTGKNEIVSIEEVKNYLRITHDYDDNLLNNLILAAIDAAENFLRLCLLQKKILITYQYLSTSTIDLPLSPVIEIEGIVSIYNKKKHLLETKEYDISTNKEKIKLHFTINALEIRYTAGYAKQNTIPHAIKNGMLLHIAEMYDRQGLASSINTEIINLYYPYRKVIL